MAHIVIEKEDLRKKEAKNRHIVSYKHKYTIKTFCGSFKKKHMGFDTRKNGGSFFYQLYYPINQERSYFLFIETDVSDYKTLLSSIKNIILWLNTVAIFFIAIFAYFLSKILTKPISKLTHRLSMMDAQSITDLNEDEFPIEFKRLAKTINSLWTKINGHLMYQKELFIGLAHELKTPLAVIKTKNSVTLLKSRDTQKYIDTLCHNNKIINEINDMTSSILDIAKSGFEQLAPNEHFAIKSFIESKSNDYKLLIENASLNLKIDLCKQDVLVVGTEVLVAHIMQNFIQNAIKFSPRNKTITLKTEKKEHFYNIYIIDEGKGLEGEIDYFAPFSKHGERGGMGLGLFLAKNAANAMGAKIGIKNRSDALGCVAFVQLVC